jgi:hypothetical protein
MGSQLNPEEQAKRLNKVKVRLERNGKVHNGLEVFQKVMGSYHNAASLIEKKVVVKNKEGAWNWNNFKITNKSAEDLLEYSRTRARKAYKRNKQKKDASLATVNDIPPAVIGGTPNQMLQVIKDINERIDEIRKSIALIGKNSSEALDRNRLNISDIRQDLSVLNKSLPTLIKRSAEDVAAAMEIGANAS